MIWISRVIQNCITIILIFFFVDIFSFTYFDIGVPFIRKSSKAAIYLYFVITYPNLKFSKNIPLLICSFPIPILFSILRWNIYQLKFYIPTLTRNMSLRSILRDGSRCSLHFIELNLLNVKWWPMKIYSKIHEHWQCILHVIC